MTWPVTQAQLAQARIVGFTSLKRADDCKAVWQKAMHASSCEANMRRGRKLRVYAVRSINFECALPEDDQA
ncbi:hypothetical protein C4K05_5214 [Pseudomonas chlororaphis subsp. aureofaciens]|uniref:Uncharacterized protein n=1 Tax=Pseudomonas chlororaphis subsp. aureofaciens TaxID=587851 RepID=A0AAD0ZN28_9PSED|nr:hypothetical protein C4K13_5300 [Pseudomonas chlororaphis subsp. aureofaciens]AZE01020.1 hypothetical protein C4K12_5177 [Pseudomonas chlororaphis subsp. aureofaciens]AZE07133.1 hypothetical protein C4K11_4995 [Pseudomonas chlororaphis subsp. aureofaciens]AZE13319.1 hypothetical protein C4K10_5063 [Pseudomonas chlororaphis subsp. aureofaciens]AZE19274.1 hypothetical protein C4K09_4837 [Pseudomonas chlororaphis subsp. aureofaciens]